MKNAYVLEDHFGDDGAVTTGMILLDVTNKRFDELEKNGLIREATAKEVEIGYQPPFTSDESSRAAEASEDAQFEQLRSSYNAAIESLQAGHDEAIERLRTDHAHTLQSALGEATAAHQSEIEKMTQDHAEQLKSSADELTKVRDDADALRAENETLRSEKQQRAPANKKAAEPSNKGS